MKKITVYLSLGFVFFSFFSCSGNKVSDADMAQKPIVTLRDKTLYKGDLDQVLPMELSGEDSIAAVKAYVDMWIDDQLMYEKAKQNVVNDKDIEELIENYRKALITNSYQERLLKEHFSKFSSDSELKAYYEQNKEKFKLEDNIVKGLYLKVPVGAKQLANFQKWYKQGTDAAVENIEKNALQNAVGYEYLYDRWVGFEEVMGNIPSLITDKRQFLQANKNIEMRDSAFVYLLNIKEYRIAGTEAPYDYIKGQLAEIFIEQRKADYLKQVKKDLYDKALSNDEIKFYNE